MRVHCCFILVGADEQSLWAAVRESGSHPHLVALLRIESFPFHRSHGSFGHCLRSNMEGLANACGVFYGQQMLVPVELGNRVR